MDTTAVRQRLEGILAELDQSQQTLIHEDAHDTEELSHADQHPADVGTEVADAEREDAVIAVVEQQRVDVQAALARVDAGTYGTCTVCGRPIGAERLEARPEAALCIDDQRRLERAY